MYHAAPAVSATAGLGIALGAVATLIAVGAVATAQGAPLHAALALGQVSMLAVAVAITRASGQPLRALGIAGAPVRFLAAAVLIGVSAWYLNLALVQALIEVEPEDVRTLRRAVEQPSLPVAMLAIAVIPAVCEEIVFRGALLRGLASRLPALLALGIGSAMFALYHLRPVQMLPTFTLGLVLGVLALRTGSVLPSVIAHALNNAAAIAVARRGDTIGSGLDAHPALALGGFGALFAAGVALALGAPAPREAGPR